MRDRREQRVPQLLRRGSQLRAPSGLGQAQLVDRDRCLSRDRLHEGGVETVAEVLCDGGVHAVFIGRGRRIARERQQHRGVSLSCAARRLCGAQPDRQRADRCTDREHHEEREQEPRVGDREREPWLDEHEVERDHAERCRKQPGTAPGMRRDQDRERVQHRLIRETRVLRRREATQRGRRHHGDREQIAARTGAQGGKDAGHLRT